MDKADFEISSFRDGALILSCGKEGMKTDLVFAEGAMRGDPELITQQIILEYIVNAVKSYQE